MKMLKGEPVNAALVRLVIDEGDGRHPIPEDEYRQMEGKLGAVFMRGFKKEPQDMNIEEWRDLRGMIADLKKELKE